jgi:hypothetical protein
MLDVNGEYELEQIYKQFIALIKKTKADLPFDVQQKYEWSLPSEGEFFLLFDSCIQKKA